MVLRCTVRVCQCFKKMWLPASPSALAGEERIRSQRQFLGLFPGKILQYFAVGIFYEKCLQVMDSSTMWCPVTWPGERQRSLHLYLKWEKNKNWFTVVNANGLLSLYVLTLWPYIILRWDQYLIWCDWSIVQSNLWGFFTQCLGRGEGERKFEGEEK